MNKENLEHLKWMYERLIYIHHENPQYDYMLKFKKILQELDIKKDN